MYEQVMDRQEFLDILKDQEINEADKLLLTITINKLYERIQELEDNQSSLESEIEDLEDEINDMERPVVEHGTLLEVCSDIIKEHVYDLPYKQYKTIQSIVEKLDRTLFHECGVRV